VRAICDHVLDQENALNPLVTSLPVAGSRDRNHASHDRHDQQRCRDHKAAFRPAVVAMPDVAQ
jgi:hypothetical protein